MVETNLPSPQKFRLTPRDIRNAGIVIYILSFLVPDQWKVYDQREYFGIGSGALMFVLTPIWALYLANVAISNENLATGILSIAMAVGWAANLTILFRPNLVVALISVAAPWVPYTYMDVEGNADLVTSPSFYVWALGIALIHLAKLGMPVPVDEPRNKWNGF